MAKKCKHCGQVVENEISICPNCQNLGFIEVTRVELSHEQLQELVAEVTEKLSKKPRLLFGLAWRVVFGLFAVLGIPGAIVGWSIWSSMQSFEQTTTKSIKTQFKALSESSSNQIAEAHLAISNDVSSSFELFQHEAGVRLAFAYALVTNQIASEFQNPQIKQTVETVAKSEAKEILTEEVQPAVDSFRKDAYFTRTIARAQAYDFKAYQQLLEAIS